jgi:4'-phosphopantetheinyl transferase
VIPSVSWCAPGDVYSPDPNELHVWRRWLDISAEEREKLAANLSPDERDRTNRFVFERDRHHFTVGRGTLREILSKYIGRRPGDIKFDTAEFGKLSLRSKEIEFNLTHSKGLAIYAFAVNQEIGIDVEKIQPAFAGAEIAERYFSAVELNELRMLPAEMRSEAFFLCWTRKEAYVKAHGGGLQIPLASFDVSLTPGQPEVLTAHDSSRWNMRSFAPAAGYIASVIAEGPLQNVKYFHYGGEPVPQETEPD